MKENGNSKWRNFNLKVELQICTSNNQYLDNLEELIYFLNEGFITHTIQGFNPYEQI